MGGSTGGRGVGTGGRTLQIRVNGEPRRAGEDVTVADLLRELDVRPDRVAVEVNLEILDRGDFERRRLRDGDRVEILSFIGGGDPGRRPRHRGGG
jgi:sulfur carrier protein